MCASCPTLHPHLLFLDGVRLGNLLGAWSCGPAFPGIPSAVDESDRFIATHVGVRYGQQYDILATKLEARWPPDGCGCRVGYVAKAWESFGDPKSQSWLNRSRASTDESCPEKGSSVHELQKQKADQT